MFALVEDMSEIYARPLPRVYGHVQEPLSLDTSRKGVCAKGYAPGNLGPNSWKYSYREPIVNLS